MLKRVKAKNKEVVKQKEELEKRLQRNDSKRKSELMMTIAEAIKHVFLLRKKISTLYLS